MGRVTVLRTLFLSDFFRSERAYFAKVKSPTELVIGTGRFGARLLDSQGQANHKLAALSQAGTVGLYFAALHFSETFDQCQADSQATVSAARWAIPLCE